MKAVDRASELLDLGFKVFPLGATGEIPPQWFYNQHKKESDEEVKRKWPKAPRGVWAKFREEGDHWEEIEKMLLAAPEHTNLAVITGLGVVVVDADSAEQVEYVLKNVTATPYRVTTAKGVHFYYRQPSFDVKNFQSKEGIDIRGTGGYVVAEGSTHETGVLYTSQIDDDFINLESLPLLTVSDVNNLSVFNGTLDKPTEKQINSSREITFQPSPVGSRNNTCAQMTGKLIQKGMGFREIKQIVDRWNESNDEPLSESELVTTITSIFSTHVNNGGAPIDASSSPILIDAPVKRVIETFDEFDAQDRFENQPVKDTDWLIGGVMEKAKPYIVAAEGDTGKSFSLLYLSLQVAMTKSDFHNQMSFGGLVHNTGKVIILSAEDNANDLNKRIRKLMNFMQIGWSDLAKRLVVIPIPDIDGDYGIATQDKDGARVTQVYHDLIELSREDGNVSLIVFDTLQSLVDCEIQADNRVAQFIARKAVELASKSGATVIFSHHFNRGKSTEPMKHPTEARDRIRGATGLVDGTRGTYVMWKASVDEGMAICEKLGELYWPDRVVFGGLCKSNGEAKKDKHTFVRNELGFLQDKTQALADAIEADILEGSLVSAIRYAAQQGHPYTLSGKDTGIYPNKETLPEKLKNLARRTIEDMAKSLIEQQRIVRFKVEGFGRTPVWLDVPYGSIKEGYQIKKEGNLKPFESQAIWDENRE